MAYHRLPITPTILVRLIVLGSIWLGTGSCLESYLAPTTLQEVGILVVDGILVPNDTTEIKLMRTRNLTSTDPTPLEEDAAVWIESKGGQTWPLTEKSQGVYVISPTDFDIYSEYRLHIRTQDTHEYASAYVPIRPGGVLDSTTWKEDTQHETIDFNVYAHDPNQATHYYLWTFDETWKYISLTTSHLYYKDGELIYRSLATDLYYCWKTVRTNNVFVTGTTALFEDRVYDFNLFKIPQSNRKLYFGYSILVRQYALTEAAYNYWSVTKKNSEQLGTLFDPLPSQPEGNFQCLSHPDEPVIGFFSGSYVSTGRVVFSRQKIIGPSQPYSPTGYEFCSLKLIPPDEMSEEAVKGLLIHDKEYDPAGAFIGYSVGPEACLDCRKKGGVNIKPDYWFD